MLKILLPRCIIISYILFTLTYCQYYFQNLAKDTLWSEQGITGWEDTKWWLKIQPMCSFTNWLFINLLCNLSAIFFRLLNCFKSCLTIFDPMHCNSQGSSDHGVFQARILKWVAISSSRGSSDPGIEPPPPTSLAFVRQFLYH